MLGALLGVGGSAGAQGLPDEAAARELLEQADEVLAAIQTISGLEAMHPIERDVQTRASLRERIGEMVRAEYTDEELAATDRLLKALGLLEPASNYTELMLDLLEEQVAGYYDQETQTFYILDDMDPSMQAGIMSHELHHALQDQHWGIDAIRGRSDRITDVSVARTALIEGDALLVMLAYSLGGSVDVWEVPMLSQLIATLSTQQAPELGAAMPRVLWDQLLFPYTGGLKLAVELGRAGGWEGLHGAYEAPPQSTEQVLHPERYLVRDEPTWLHFDVSGAVRGTRYAVDVFGEYTIASVLRQLLPTVAPAACDRAASGWDGDRLEAWALPDGGELIVWLSAWDEPSEALGFIAVAERLGAAWIGAGEEQRAAGEHGSGLFVTSEQGAFHAEVWGDLALVVAVRGGDPRQAVAAANAAVEAVWRTHRRFSYPFGI